jgi:hypothetical protein
MGDIFEILQELRGNNSINNKLAILKDNAGNKTLQRLLQMTYDKVRYNFYISPKSLDLKSVGFEEPELSFKVDYILDMLEQNLCNRTVTGNAARDFVRNLMRNSNHEGRDLIVKILDRDLRINMGRTLINKVWKDLITKPPYMRCSIYSEKTAKKISFPAIVQLKADGTFRYAIVSSHKVTFISRSGEEYTYPELEAVYTTMPDGVYVGELLVKGMNNRAEANGLINSDNPPHDKIYHSIWDYVSLGEYSSGLGSTPYIERFNALRAIFAGVTTDKINLIESHEVDTLEEAVTHTVHWMSQSLEGAILKGLDNVFKNHTSPTMLKLKVEAESEVVCTGFTEGTKGTKREATFGAITFESADGLVKGQTSGFSDVQLEDFNSRREELIGRVFTVRYNDLTKARDSDSWAFSHPRFIEFRDDKDEADTFDKIQESLASAKQFK